jgi:hypothetical protein
MDDMLGSLLGGSQGEEQAGGGDMLSALLGMLAAGGQGGTTDLLGALTGGGQVAGSEVNGISEQTGIPSEIVMAGLSFLFGKLTGGGQQGATSGAGGMDLAALMGSMQQGSTSGGSGSGTGLEELLQGMQGDQAGPYIESTGMSQDFAQQTGLDPEQASQALQGVLGALRSRGVSG